MPSIHVITNKMHADPRRLTNAVAIVVDIVFATTGIAIALEHGASEVVPTLDPESARAYASTLLPDSFLLAGEQDGFPIPGFIEPWPHLLMRQELSGKQLVYSTTNGTVALKMVASASLVLATALVNGKAVVEYACQNHAGRDIVLICAGSGPSFSLEDFYGAGYLVSLLVESGIDFHLTDAARAARLLHDRAGVGECLEDTYAGRMMAAHGLSADLAFCGQKSIFSAVPVFHNDRITRV
jgi:2-phosphosulfolactate phosphatase